MKVLLCGLGKFGTSFIQTLQNMGCVVVFVDESHEAVSNVLEHYDIACHVGRPSDMKTLMQAGVDGFDLVFALTDNDEANMIICLMCHDLFNIKMKVAQVNKVDCGVISGLVHVDLLFNPAFEISSYIKYHFLGNIHKIAFGQISIVVVDLCKESLVESFSKFIVDDDESNKQFVGLINNEEEFVVSSFVSENVKETVVLGNKLVFFFDTMTSEGQLERIKTLVSSEDEKNTILIGAGAVGKNLLAQLGRDTFTVVIDKDIDAARAVADSYKGLEVICGDALGREFLEEAGVSCGKKVVVVTGCDKSNIIISMIASKMGAEVPITMVNNNFMQGEVYKDLGLHNLLYPVEILEERLLQFLTVNRFYNLGKGKRGFFYLYINSDALNQIEFAKSNFSSLILLYRDQEIIIPTLLDGLDFKVNDRLIFYLDKDEAVSHHTSASIV